MKLQQTFFIAAAPKKVMNVMRDSNLIEEDEKGREALSVEVKDLKKTKAEHIYEVHTVNYARGVTGIDRSKTENNKTTMTWDLKKNTATWVFSGGGAHADKAKVSGGTILSKQGEGTEVELFVDIDISVPLVGKKIAAMVAKGFKTEWPKYIERVSLRAKA